MFTAVRAESFRDSFDPEFTEGGIVIINPHLEVKSGDYVVVKNDEEEATFTQFKKCGYTAILHPLTPKYPDIVLKRGDKYRLVGKVMRKERAIGDIL